MFSTYSRDPKKQETSTELQIQPLKKLPLKALLFTQSLTLFSPLRELSFEISKNTERRRYLYKDKLWTGYYTRYYKANTFIILVLLCPMVD